jgi:hypothetical protein
MGISLGKPAGRMSWQMKRSSINPAPVVPPSDPTKLGQWLLGIARLNECAALRGVHPETYKREAAREGRELIQLSKRAVGDHRFRALRLPNPLGGN